MKAIARDDGALLPLLVGLVVAGGALVGGSYLLYDDPMTSFISFLKAITVGSMLFVFGILLLMNKLTLIPGHIAVLAGIACVAVGLYFVWQGVPL